MRIAVTGGTGFVGSRMLALAAEREIAVSALTRRPQSPTGGIDWVSGTLEDEAALDRLVEGADAVIHIAGVVNAPDRAGFHAGNVAGTRAILSAVTRSGVKRFVHVSSLAARERDLSNYGWSKAEAEDLVDASALEWDMVRPPAIYGPGDMDILDMFRMAKRGVALLPPGGRLSVLEVGDLARLLLTLAETPATRAIHEADDGIDFGWSHTDLARAIGDAVGRRVATFALPHLLLSAGAQLDRLLRGQRAKLTPDRVAYFCHQDWVIDPARRPPAALWSPEIETRAGLAATAAWYRDKGLL